MAKPIIIFVFALLALSFLLRTVGLLENNALLLFDSARDFLWVNKILIEHKPILIGVPAGGLEGYFHGAIWYYLLAIPLFLAKGHPISGQWFMAILSTLSVFSAFYFLKKSMNIYAAVLGLVIFGLAAFSVATAKFSWNPYPPVLLMPAFFYGIYLLSKGKPLGIILVSIVQGLTLQFDFMIGFTTFPAYTLMLGYFLKTSKKEKIKYLLISILIIGIPFIPSLLFDLRHNFIISKAVITTISTRGSNLTHTGDEQKSLIQRIPDRLRDLERYSVKSVTENNYVNYALLAILILAAFKMLGSKQKEYKTLLALSLSVFVSMFLVLLSLKYSVWQHYWGKSAPFYAMLLSFSLGYLIQKYNKKFFFGFLCLFLFIIYQPWVSLSQWKKGDLSPGPQVISTQVRVVDTIYKDANGEKFSVYLHTPPVYDYTYRYLFSWKGRGYGFIPPNEKQKLVYVILEGVPEDKTGAYFKNNVLHLKGKPSETFSFDSSYPIVEKFEITENEEPVDPNFFPQL